jgi:hypothetical protein
MTANAKNMLLIGAAGIAAFLIYKQFAKPTVYNQGLLPGSIPGSYQTYPAAYPGTMPTAYNNNAAQIISASTPAITSLASQISSWFSKPSPITSSQYI